MATLAFSEAATVYKRQTANGAKKRLVVRKRQRGNRQLFGNRVVPAPFAAPIPLAPRALPLAAQPLPIAAPALRFAQQPIRVVEVNPQNFYAPAPAPVPAPTVAPVPVPAPAPVQPAAPIIQVRAQEPLFTAPVTVAATRQAPAVKPIAITRSVYNAPGTILNR